MHQQNFRFLVESADYREPGWKWQSDPGQETTGPEYSDSASPFAAIDNGRDQSRSGGGIGSIAVLSPRS